MHGGATQLKRDGRAALQADTVAEAFTANRDSVFARVLTLELNAITIGKSTGADGISCGC